MILGRKLLEDLDPLSQYYNHPDMVQRRIVLKQTVDTFTRADPSDHYHRLAMVNLDRWKHTSKAVNPVEKIQVLQGDWGQKSMELVLLSLIWQMLMCLVGDMLRG